MNRMKIIGLVIMGLVVVSAYMAKTKPLFGTPTEGFWWASAMILIFGNLLYWFGKDEERKENE